MILIGRDLSPFVRRTATTLNLLGLDYEREQIAAADAVEYIRKYNPLARVPTLIVDDDAIIDSAAIIDYALELTADHQTLLPSAGTARRVTLKHSAIATGIMEKSVVAAYERTQRPPEYVYQPYRERVLGQVSAGCVELDQALGDRTCVGGDAPDLADVNAVVAYDFTGIVAQQTRDGADLKHLAGLSERANRIDAFAATRWQG